MTANERNHRGHHEVRPTWHDAVSHVPDNTADEAFLLIGDVEIHFDASSRESRAQALAALAVIRRCVDNMEEHLRVIRVAPEHAQTSS